ncbi:HK97 family phage prohead protease [Paracoccus sp. TD-10]|uniref:HK97 family phage prohead protease n=1 Tax=Paracoccus sp. TD-10 TaxID=3395918 RepID=UPI003AAABD75
MPGHRSGSTRDQLGVVEAAELRPEGLWVRMKFRSNDAARAVLADIAEGTLRGLSIGYSVRRWSEGRESGRRVRKALQWSPVEVSIVPVPADPGAHFRNGETPMPETAETTTTTTQAGGETVTRAAINAEIRTIAETAGLTRAWADAQIDAEASAEDARAAAFTEMRKRAEATTTRTTRAEVGFSHDDPTVIATRAGEALYARSHPEHQLSEAARPYRSWFRVG